jgi:RNA polymerase sigma-70 factor, ECF subfamily
MVQGDDGQLVARVLAGEKTVFGLLIDRYRPEGIRLAGRIIGDAVDAEDIVQEALLQAFLGLNLVAESRFLWPLAVGDHR